MLKNYVKTAIRNILRQKGYSLINILGLSIGLAATILIMLWVSNELSFNRNNENFGRIYRIVQQQQYTSGPLTTPCMPAPLARDLRTDFPEFDDLFRFYEVPGVISIDEEKRFAENVRYADSGLFKVFSFNFIEGSAETALKPYTAILSKKGAERFFGNEDPVGKVIKLNNEISFKVNGIIEDPPENSSFTSELYLPFEHLSDIGLPLDRYGWNSYYIYAQINGNANVKAINEKIRHYFKQVRNDETLTTELFLFPLKKERLWAFDGDPALITNIYIFSVIAVFILLIACINFMNLATARASKRGREIGLRKVVGARRKQLIYQFMSESILMALIALVFALALVHLFLPIFNELTATELSLNIFSPLIALVLLGIAVLTGIIAGSYPAFYLSSLKPLITLRKSTSSDNGNPWFRRSLVIFQFVLSIALIISTMVIYKQMSYINNKDLGMNKENVIYARLRGDLSEKFYDFKAKLVQNPGVLSATRSSHLPFYVGSNSGGLIWEGKDNDDDVLIGFERSDYDYLETMQMELAEGRFFEKGYSSDTAAVVVNESAVRTMGMGNPVGKWIGFENNRGRYKIIGVVKDFNFLPLNREIEPLSIYWSETSYSYMLLKLDGTKTAETIDYVESLWDQYLPAFPFEYNFLDEYYGRLYTNVTRLSKLISYFAILAILISCLGLFGLASFTAQQKTKEIGIRKVLGSSITKILALQQKEFFWLVLAANIISWPLAWYFMKDWLDTFAFKIELSPLFFMSAGVLSIAITFITVFILSYRAAIKNPVDAIKCE